MARKAFHAQLDDLNQELRSMGCLVQQAITFAVNALVNRDLAAAKRVVDGDQAINGAYARVERLCLDMIALQQPLAGDLRRIASALKVITDLERMADHAVDIARVVIRIGDQPHVKPLVDIPAMGALVQEMVSASVVAFVGEDRDLALAMVAKDHEVDRLHRTIIEDLEKLMQRDNSTIHQGIQLLFVSSALERIGDHATNLGEWLIYLQTGERTELNN